MVNTHPISNIKEGSWTDFRDAVKAVDSELFQIVEQISPNEKYKLFEVTYLYGEKITDLGTICLPDKNGHVYRLDSTIKFLKTLMNLLAKNFPYQYHAYV